MGAFLIVVLTPILQLFLSICKAQEPMCVQTFGPEAAVECFDEGVVGGFAGPGKVQRNPTLISPQIQVA